MKIGVSQSNVQKTAAYRTDKEPEAVAVTSGGGGVGRAGEGFLGKVFKVFSLDRVQQRFVDRSLRLCTSL